jgi:hypothetical protein
LDVTPLIVTGTESRKNDMSNASGPSDAGAAGKVKVKVFPFPVKVKVSSAQAGNAAAQNDPAKTVRYARRIEVSSKE